MTGGAGELEALRQQLVLFAGELNRLLERQQGSGTSFQQAVGELEGAYLNMVESLAFVVEAKDAYTRDHLERTHTYAVALARRIAPEIADDQALGYGFLLHDVGKVGIPESILGKPGPLSEAEWGVMRSHPELGAEIVSPMPFLAPALEVIRSHHERWDGTGYPDGLRGRQIPLAARIFTVADTFDAMTSDRPYRGAMPFEAALDEIARHAGSQFDGDVVDGFLDICDELGPPDAPPPDVAVLAER